MPKCVKKVEQQGVQKETRGPEGMQQGAQRGKQHGIQHTSRNYYLCEWVKGRCKHFPAESVVAGLAQLRACTVKGSNKRCRRCCSILKPQSRKLGRQMQDKVPAAKVKADGGSLWNKPHIVTFGSTMWGQLQRPPPSALSFEA